MSNENILDAVLTRTAKVIEEEESHKLLFGEKLNTFIDADGNKHLLTTEQMSAAIKKESLTISLKSCPFCAGKAEYIEKSTVDGPECFVSCTECGCMTKWFTTGKEAIATWNTRKASTN